ncbi:pyridoxamine 5'-phosphate oxidase [Methanobacterium sp. CWC-01]|uniref:pyridoxamine 5'-phosphate oxidase family protein n=1 Tax=Methanobacterium aridiramus TaxID=2584467 RepID=UPI0025770F67|nr:pyridoxamine 5'-phosphate oxidase family protein [Methanobacterium sp. CWC-01]WJI08825.1 pyridoxamine 5'-phosphate oxidase [Methanobacterium sp. CWC-01]
MEFGDCIKFASENPIAWIATVEKDQPRVRAFGMWFADETGFYFQTATIKEIVAQLQTNPKVEFAFYQPDDMTGTMLRVSGEVEFLDDLKLKEKVIKDRPFLKELGMTPQDERLIIFRVAKGEAHFWNWESNLMPKDIIKFG